MGATCVPYSDWGESHKEQEEKIGVNSLSAGSKKKLERFRKLESKKLMFQKILKFALIKFYLKIAVPERKFQFPIMAMGDIAQR